MAGTPRARLMHALDAHRALAFAPPAGQAGWVLLASACASEVRLWLWREPSSTPPSYIATAATERGEQGVRRLRRRHHGGGSFLATVFSPAAAQLPAPNHLAVWTAPATASATAAGSGHRSRRSQQQQQQQQEEEQEQAVVWWALAVGRQLVLGCRAVGFAEEEEEEEEEQGDRRHRSHVLLSGHRAAVSAAAFLPAPAAATAADTGEPEAAAAAVAAAEEGGTAARWLGTMAQPWLVSASEDRTLRLWDAASGTALAESSVAAAAAPFLSLAVHGGSPLCCGGQGGGQALRPARCAVGSADGKLRLYDLRVISDITIRALLEWLRFTYVVRSCRDQYGR
jgi:hypothetical protein